MTIDLSSSGVGGNRGLMNPVQDCPRAKIEDTKCRIDIAPRRGTHTCPSIETKLEAAKYVIKGYNSRGNKVRCLSPIHRPVHCTAWLSRSSCITVTAHTAHAF